MQRHAAKFDLSFIRTGRASHWMNSLPVGFGDKDIMQSWIHRSIKSRNYLNGASLLEVSMLSTPH